ncbi:MAG: hypothetical protein R3B13_19585 [Polyangiaceae bacterium]
MTVHPTTRTWQLPPARPELPPPLRRANLRALAARPERFEHHLTVVAQTDDAQLEIATASEPLYFAHANLSDEYALALTTGDDLVDAAPLRTFFSDPATGEDLSRVNHVVGDLLLHPYGAVHWPGRLRPPYAPPDFGPFGRRALLSLVFCAPQTTVPGQREVRVDRADCFKTNRDPGVVEHLVDTKQGAAGVVARVASSTLSLLIRPERVCAERGGYLLCLAARAPHADNALAAPFPMDLVWIPAGEELDASGVERALFFESQLPALPPPPSWDTAPPPPFPCFEDAQPTDLPVELGDLEFVAAGDDSVEVRCEGRALGLVPRHWLARFLFRLPLHEFRLGYLETYGGFFYDDRGKGIRFGIRGAAETELPREGISDVVQRAYGAVAPRDYRERLE